MEGAIVVLPALSKLGGGVGKMVGVLVGTLAITSLTGDDEGFGVAGDDEGFGVSTPASYPQGVFG